MTASVALPLRIGARTVAHVRRRLIPTTLGLEAARSGALPALDPLPSACDGYWVVSLAAASLQQLLAQHPELTAFVRQRYRRSYVSFDGDFVSYLGSFSGKSRSTLKRKLRKLADRSGGVLDLRIYRSAAEMDEFYRHARTVSALTYQERLLGCGLPEGDEFLEDLRSRARRDAVRGWVLFLDGAPISYLYAPADGDTLIYHSLGYDPEHAGFSPGAVLQFEAMRQLFEEGRFRLFDFTNGEGQHKTQFATGSIDCLDLLLLRPTLSNHAAGHLLNAFDAAVAALKKSTAALKLERLVRSVMR
ncbi:MAG: GNAT family N-acetyltransferase [Pseudomonadota bacterium]|nr:GNAT family N-acetyltransferase [Pseudomonadota bacterium]